MSLKDRINKCLTEGFYDENKFAHVFLNTCPGWGWRYSSKREDIESHIDGFLVSPDGKEWSYDFKGIKHIKANQGEPNPNFEWFEILNVKGEKGSLYGEQEFIILEQPNKYLVFWKKDIQDFLRSRVCNAQIETMPKYEKYVRIYTRYRREKRQDLVVLVPTKDLEASIKNYKLNLTI